MMSYVTVTYEFVKVSKTIILYYISIAYNI